jgi:hypothetical protein
MDGTTVTCSNCGSQVRAGVRFCPECGRIMSDAAAADKGRVAGGSEAGADLGQASTDDWRDTLSRGESGSLGSSSGDVGALGGETRQIPETPFPAPYGEPGTGNSGSGTDSGAYTAPPIYGGYTPPAQSGSSSAPTQANPPPPPRYDDRPQYTPPPGPAGRPTQTRDYTPPVVGIPTPMDPMLAPVPMGYGQPMVGFNCPYCRTTIPPVSRERVSQTGWIVLVILLITCFPLFWIGLLIKEPYRVCSQCGNTLS